jgi:hypothetical protein
MMAEIVNLRLARKAKKRADEKSQAAANRAKFGQTMAAKDVQRIEAKRSESRLDGAKREPE